MDPVVCDSCGARFPVKELSDDDYRALEDKHDYLELADELQMLVKVREYYRRHPEAEGRIKSRPTRLLESNDPEVNERLRAGVPFDQIDLPPEQLPAPVADDGEDREVVEYLRHDEFALGPRIHFVSERVSYLRGSLRVLACPSCKLGRLAVSPDGLDEFNSRDTITWYWPEWNDEDSDGTLYVKASGWQGQTHWTGQTTIRPEESDYDLWRWLVAQREYHQLVEKSELAAIRDAWARQFGRST